MNKEEHFIKTELLAPAGNYECLQAAFAAGADAVYLAGKQYGARAFAANFETDELIEALRYAHLLNKKIYLTLNTLIKESEFAEIYDFIRPYYENGLDGIIIQDLGLIPFLKEYFPNLELHASTQMTVNNWRSAKFLKESGIKRVVPSRELSLDEIKEIKEKANVEVETFIHGALCYCYSGQCLFSSFLGGRSGNRGKCAQPCRLPYRIKIDGTCQSKKGEQYPLSLKDLCTINQIYELLDSRIDSFKIEGRMKSPEYVAGVTSVYRKYMDSYYAGKRPEIAKEDLFLLNHLYIRSNMKDGYYYRHNGKDMITLNSPSYQANDEKLVSLLHEKYCTNTPKIPICATVQMHVSKPISVTFSCNGKQVTQYGEVVLQATNRPLTESEVKKQIQKTGNTPFYVSKTEISIDSDSFLPIRALNEIRRTAISQLEEQLLKQYRQEAVLLKAKCNKKADNELEDKTDRMPEFSVSVFSREQYKTALCKKISRIYIPSDLFYPNGDTSFLDEQDYSLQKIELFLSLPRIIRKRDEDYLVFLRNLLRKKNFAGVLVKNLEELQFLDEISYEGKIITDHNLYVFNQAAKSFLCKNCYRFCAPLELNRNDITKICDSRMEYVVYGHMPMMVTANCIRKTSDQCKHHKNDSFSQSLTDRYQKELPVACNCIHCYNEIYNAVALSLLKEIKNILNMGILQLRLDFTVESPQETGQIIDAFLKAAETECSNPFPGKEFTTGHYTKGVL